MLKEEAILWQVTRANGDNVVGVGVEACQSHASQIDTLLVRVSFSARVSSDLDVVAHRGSVSLGTVSQLRPIVQTVSMARMTIHSFHIYFVL
jgi:hypothetical protein